MALSSSSRKYCGFSFHNDFRRLANILFWIDCFMDRRSIDWFMDRLRTTLNVTGDAVVCGMVSHLTNTEDHENVPDLEGTTGVDVPPKEIEGDEA